MKEFLEKALQFYEAAGSPTIPIPDRHPTDTSDTVRISQLDTCPLSHAFSKRGVEMTHPESRNLWLMGHGTWVAKRFQMAAMWYAMHHTNWAVDVEVPYLSKEKGMAGVIDMVVHEHDHSPKIVEFKDTEGAQRRSVGDVKHRYALQVIGYSMLSGIVDDMYIVTTSRWGWYVYRMKYLGWTDSPEWELLDLDGSHYDASWNTPDQMNYNTVQGRVQERLEWMSIARSLIKFKEEQGVPFTPPVDPLKNMGDKEWLQCCRVLDKGKKTDRNGTPPRTPSVAPACEYFGHCYGNLRGEIRLVETEDGYKFPKE